MKLATLSDGSTDGRLVIVSRDLKRALSADPVARTLQEALDSWETAEEGLRHLANELEASHIAGEFAFDPVKAMAPLPRAWQWLDGSAFDSHGALLEKVFRMDPVPRDKPLMYQGLSHLFYGPCEEIPFRSEADGIDFEGEFAVIVDKVPLGATASRAESHIKLLVQINDWSLRALVPAEVKTGFGFVQAKPPCSMAPVAVTPDELGNAWRDGRVGLPLEVRWNDVHFGAPNGSAMSVSFPDLIAHASATRPLCAGTIIGSGTVSNENFREIGSTCIAERRGIEIVDEGKARTEYMRYGDRVRMEARTLEGGPLFGCIDQKVVPAREIGATTVLMERKQ